MDKTGKTILGVLGGIFAVNLVTNILGTISAKQKEKELEELNQKTRNTIDNWYDTQRNLFKDIPDPNTAKDSSTKWIDDMIKSLEEENTRKALENEKRTINYLYAVIKQRKTLMKSEEEFLSAVIRQNKIIDGDIDLEKCTDQEIIRYLETKCKFDIFSNVPMLTSEKKAVSFHSLQELGINYI